MVYWADQATDNVYELYSVPIAGGTPVKLNGTLVSGGSVQNYQISADSRRVVYWASQDSTSVYELYSVPIAGGTPIKLNGALVSGGSVQDFQISTNSSRVVYYANQDSASVYELYIVPITGGTPIKLNGALVSGGNVQGFQISADSSRVVYLANQDLKDVSELYSVSIWGGTPVKLNGTLAAGGNIQNYQISPNNRRVVYWASQDSASVYELYSVLVTGGTPIKLNGALVSGGNVQGFQISADSASVLFHANQDRFNMYDLYLWKPQAFWATSGGNWTDTLNWTNGGPPDATTEAVIKVPAIVRLPFSTAPTIADYLVLGCPDGESVLELVDGAALSLRRGVLMSAGAVLRGDGLVDMGATTLAVPAGGELRAADGESFTLQSGAVLNAGRIEALGTTYQPAEMEFSGVVSNLTGTGAVVGQDAVFRFLHGLENWGSLSFGNGVNDVEGDVTNRPGGRVIVSGGATAIFYEDVANQGMINVSAAGGLQSVAVFFGALAGNGISGGGAVFIEGDTRPGFSPAVMAFGGDVTCGPQSSWAIELGGTKPGVEYDRITVAGRLSLNGTLNVSLLNGFSPKAGMAFDLWDAGAVDGQFAAVNLPALPAGLFWHTSELATTGILRVGLTPGSYANYAAYYGLTTGPNGDQDRDGRSNLVEYLLGSNPMIADFGPGGLWVWHEADGVHVSFTMVDPPGSDLIVDLQASTALPAGTNWETIATRTGNGTWTGSAAIGQVVSVAGLAQVNAVQPTSGAPARFYRYQIRLVP